MEGQPSVLQKAEEVLRSGISLCDSCFGRLFGMRGYNLSNSERGRALKTVLMMQAFSYTSRKADLELLRLLAESGFRPAAEVATKLKVPFEPKACFICEGLTGHFEDIARRIIEEYAEYEFETFQIGVRLARAIISREEQVWRMFGLSESESLKNEISREVGKLVERLSSKRYASEKPEMLIIINIPEAKLESISIEFHPSPVFLCGRYLKLVRGLPQSPWPHPDERVLYPTSIEELITAPLVEHFKASGAKLHAAGREDIDARTLGTGRPFVVEIKRPKLRTFDLKRLEEVINERAQGLIQVHSLRYCGREYIKKYKSLAELAKKSYVVRVEFDRVVSEEELAKLCESLRNIVVDQRTPRRVLHRRPDKLRRKLVYKVEARKISEREVEFYIEAQGGFYVKEFIHGDEGRTRPSIAELLGAKVMSIQLDVVSVEEP
jgi:tRNA pseudouridine synthase 10